MPHHVALFDINPTPRYEIAPFVLDACRISFVCCMRRAFSSCLTFKNSSSRPAFGQFYPFKTGPLPSTIEISTGIDMCVSFVYVFVWVDLRAKHPRLTRFCVCAGVCACMCMCVRVSVRVSVRLHLRVRVRLRLRVRVHVRLGLRWRLLAGSQLTPVCARKTK
jgi:hypothetical protein